MAESVPDWKAPRDWRECGAAELHAAAAYRRDHWASSAVHGLSDEALAATNAPRYHMQARDYGNGHREACVWLHQVDAQKQLAALLDRDAFGKAARGEGDREASIAAASRRAKKRVRQLCKAMGVNSLWTLTYRANQVDRQLALKHLKAFVRRVNLVLPDFRYLAVLEQQERGAWHVHLATHALPQSFKVRGFRVKSWNLLRSIWRDVVGALGGNFDESKRRKRNGNRPVAMRDAGAIAAYLAGYVAKDMIESELNRKRFSHSVGVSVPEALRAQWVAASVSMRELIELAYAAVGERINRAFYCSESGLFFVSSFDAPSG